MDLVLVGFGLMASHGVSHVASTIAVALRLRARPEPKPLADYPPVTLLRPVCGLENFIEESLRTSFTLTYPKLEVIFCVDEESDPVVPLVRRLIAEYPAMDARLLVGRDRIGANPKLNNLVKGWKAARSDWIIMSDSNALLPPDFIQTLLVRWRPNTGVVSTAASVTRPESFAAEIECAFVNSLQGRWMMLADMAGFGFAQGRTLMWRREILEQAGGLRALTTEAADELAATRIVRKLGLRARLARLPLPQAIGRRRFREVWRRQVRWARLRRAGFPLLYPAEIFLGAAVPFACALGVTLAGRMPAIGLVAYVAAWYGLEAMLVVAGRFPISVRMPLAWLARDALLPVIWVVGWVGNRFEWRGTAMDAAAPTDGTPPMRKAGST